MRSKIAGVKVLNTKAENQSSQGKQKANIILLHVFFRKKRKYFLSAVDNQEKHKQKSE